MIEFQPMGSNILVKPEENTNVTSSGIYIPDSIQKERSQQGTVVSIGHGKVNSSGIRIPVSVQIGDVVMYPKYVGVELKMNNETYLVIDERDLLGIVRMED